MRNESNSSRIEYIRNIFANEDDALHNVGSDLNDGAIGMQVGAEEGKTLFVLARMIGAKKIIEVGVLAGYSSVWMARSLPKDGKLYALEKGKNRIEPIRKNYEACGVADKIELIEGDALASLSSIEGQGPFDMIFIDADKANYCNYLDWAEKNIRKGGLIVGDNTFLFGTVYGDDKRKMKEEIIAIMDNFNKRLGNNEKYSSVMIPTEEGMTVAIKEF